MSEWIDCKVELPKNEMRLLVLIGDKVFEGESFYPSISGMTIWDSKTFIRFEMQVTTKNRSVYDYIAGADPLPVTFGTNKWHVPSHFKEPSHWMPMPEVPK